MNDDNKPIRFDTTDAIDIVLTWMGDIDLDLSAFMLGMNGYINNDADLVFYNSINRSEEYDSAKFPDRDAWLSKTRPVSQDGSLVGALDAEGSQNENSKECMRFDLSKVSSDICRVIFCASVFVKQTASAKVPAEAKLIVRSTSQNSIMDVPLTDLGADGNNSVEIFELSRLDDSQWNGTITTTYLNGGLQTIIDKYV